LKEIEGLIDDEYSDFEPIISKSIEIRDLASFIKNDKALSEMESTRSFVRGLLASGEIDRQSYEKNLNDLEKSMDNLHAYKDMISSDDLETLQNIKRKFLEFIPKKSTLDMTLGNYSICFEHDNNSKQFSEIKINKYKIFKNFKIEKLKRINIFAGFNNSGKTSLLEAIYFLTKQNDIVSFLEIIKFKNKLKSLNPMWLNEVFDKNDIIDIEGIYNDVNTSIKFSKFEATSIDKKDDYISSYKLNALINDRELDNTIHTFGYETLKRENEKVEHLCYSIFKSPYFYNLDEIVKTYNKNTKDKDKDGNTAINLVVEFIKKIDPTILDIRLNDIEEIERFRVISSKFKDKNLEITNYGEGLQRVFEIALSFAYSKNGIVCLDEFETAIHNSLLIEFTKFIQELADTFNVQVFLTSHSKECIDAFVNNDYKNDEISAYLLINKDNKITTKFVSGDRLKYLVENISLDIRGDNDE